MKKKYITLLYIKEDEDLAIDLVNHFYDRYVEVHKFVKTKKLNNKLLADLNKSSALIILSKSKDFNYLDYYKELKKADAKSQIIACYKNSTSMQLSFRINNIILKDNYTNIELMDDILCIIAGAYNKIRVNIFTKKRLKKEAFRLFDVGEYVWSLAYLLKLFDLKDREIKEKIASAYKTFKHANQAINYFSICLISDKEKNINGEFQGLIYNNLGCLYTEMRNLTFAEKYLKLAIECKNPEALFNLAYLYETSYNYDSKTTKKKESYELYHQVLISDYTSEEAKEKARKRLDDEAAKELEEKHYDIALKLYKFINNQLKEAECLRLLKYNN